MQKFRKTHRANNPAANYDILDLPDNTQSWGADNIPIGLRDGSYAAGTPRDQQLGRGYLGNNSAFVECTPPVFDLYTLNSFSIEATIDRLDSTGVNSAIYGYRSSSTELFQMSFSDGAGTNAVVFLLRDDAGVFQTLVGTSFDLLTDDYVTFKAELINIQTATPTINLYENSVIVDTITYTKGTKLESARELVGGVATNTVPGSSAVRLSVNKLFNFKQYVNGSIEKFYKCDEGLGDIIIDSSGNGYNGTIQNLYAGFHTTSPFINSYQNVFGYTVSDGATYYYDVALTQLIPTDVLIPRDESIILPPFKCSAYITGGIQADLQYIGLCPSKASFEETPCFEGDGSGYYRPTFTSVNLLDYNESTICIYAEKQSPLTEQRYFSFRAGTGYLILERNSDGDFKGIYSDTVNLLNVTSLGTPQDLDFNKIEFIIKVDTGVTLELVINGVTADLESGALGGTLSSPSFFLFRGQSVPRNVTQKYYDFKLVLDSSVFMWYPMCEEIIDAGNHTAYDVSGNDNHVVLTSGSLNNYGTARRINGDYSQLGKTIGNGSNGAPVGHIIPALSTDLTKDAYGGSLEYIQDGKSFINTGTKLEFTAAPNAVNSDFNNIIFNTSGEAIRKHFSDFIGVETGDYMFEDISQTDKITNFRLHPNALVRAQLDTEKRITNN